MVTEAQKAAARKWDQENMTRLSCKVTKERAVRFRAACERNKTNPNAVLLAHVIEYIKANEAQE